MIYEIRTYQLAPGSVAEVEKRFGEAYQYRKKYSELTGFFHTEIGPLNEIIHIWGYQDLADRARVRADAAKDANWPPKIQEYIRKMRSEIVVPFGFVPQVRPGKLGPIPWVYAEIARVIADHEHVEILCASEEIRASACDILAAHAVRRERVRLHVVPTDRVWLRDSAPTGVIDATGEPLWLNWAFNAWAKYDNWAQDAKVGEAIAAITSRRRVEPQRADARGRIVLEGGGIEVNGDGAMLVSVRSIGALANRAVEDRGASDAAPQALIRSVTANRAPAESQCRDRLRQEDFAGRRFLLLLFRACADGRKRPQASRVRSPSTARSAMMRRTSLGMNGFSITGRPLPFTNSRNADASVSPVTNTTLRVRSGPMTAPSRPRGDARYDRASVSDRFIFASWVSSIALSIALTADLA